MGSEFTEVLWSQKVPDGLRQSDFSYLLYKKRFCFFILEVNPLSESVVKDSQSYLWDMDESRDKGNLETKENHSITLPCKKKWQTLNENLVTPGFILPIYQKENKVQVLIRWYWAKQMLISMPENIPKDSHSEKANNFLTVCRNESSSKSLE